MKKIVLALQDLFDIPTSEIFNPDNFSSVSSISIDSRSISQNSLFIAIKGEKFDGHDFIEDAIKNGAKAIMVNREWLLHITDNELENLDIPIIAVDDTIKGLGDAAKIWRRKLNAKVIGITGSSGKTSTKEMLAMILAEKFSVNRTLANNNNHIGVPLTIFSSTNKHEILVLELGTNHFGEIEYTSQIAQPDYAVITNIGNSHLEYLKNREGVLKEKRVLLETTADRGGVVFINNDDKLLKDLMPEYKNRITFGLDNMADAHGRIVDYDEEGKALIEFVYKNKKLGLSLPLWGKHNAANFIVAAAIAFKIGLTKDEIINGVKRLTAAEKRLNVIKFKDKVLIDDTYNANPESMTYAIELLPRFKKYQKRVAVLGDMFELGENANKLHSGLAGAVKKSKLDLVLLLGENMKNLHEALAGSNTKSIYFKNREEAAEYLSKTDLAGTVILVKGSRGMKMEEFADIIRMKSR